MVTEGNLMSQLIRKKVSRVDPVSRVLYKRFKQVTAATTLGEVSRMLDREHFVLVVSAQRCCESHGK
jgi:cystathionine beta-synthase